MEKLKKHNILYIICFIISFIILLSSINFINTIKIQAKTVLDNNPKSEMLKVLTTEQVMHFLKEKNITALDIKNIENFTVILSESNNIIKFYALAPDKNGHIKYQCVGSSDSQDNDKVSIGAGGGGGLEFGTYSFNWIVINDTNILNNAYSIKITYNDKTQSTELIDNKKGFIIPTSKRNLKESNITIYDKIGNVIYKKIIKT